jgi:glycosyltransferase involved in cell wall biosynthesis
MLNPAIVVIAYNRPNSLKRLLNSIASASYDYNDIPLIISIDYHESENQKVIEVAESFDWKYGEKKIINYQTNIGLRQHVLNCGDLSIEYGSIIMLEDDLVASPYFYHYSILSLNFYREDEKIAGISLYSYRFNEMSNCDFIPVSNGYDNFFMQVPSSCGQCWTYNQWSLFKTFFNAEGGKEINESDLLPEAVKRWPETSWKKYFYKYISNNGLFISYPYYSLTTNFGDIGTHYSSETNIWQSLLEVTKKEYKFSELGKSHLIYDYNFELSGAYLRSINNQLKNYDLECDLLGDKSLSSISKPYLLSIKNCTHPIKSFGSNMTPIELNVILNNEGGIFHLGKTETFVQDSITAKDNLYGSNLQFIKRQVQKLKSDSITLAAIKKSYPYRLGKIISFPFRILRRLFKYLE